MTIHKNRGTGAIKFECDCCSEIFDPETTDFRDAVEQADIAGWRYRKKDGESQHLCAHPSCRWPK